MTDRVLFDTHIAIWYFSNDPRLRPSSRQRIERMLAEAGDVHVSAVSVWETAFLVHRGRIALDESLDPWVARMLSHPRIRPVPVTLPVTQRAYRLPRLDHGDPADRLLIATAIELGCPLVSYDRILAAYAQAGGRDAGFAVLS